MNFDTLWIGDEIFIRSKQKIGKWEGMASPGYGRVRCDHKDFVLPLDDLADVSEAPAQKDVGVEEKLVVKKPTQVENQLDLHMEKLNPSLLHQAPELILGHQLRRCRSFIDDAIRARKVQVTIIHGKGTGALKTEVLNLLHSFSQISNIVDRNNGGATEIWFIYY